MSHEHFKTMCNCGKVINQCRCMSSNKIITIEVCDECKAKSILLPTDEAQLRVHGNGFLQAATSDGGKIHIWDQRLPRQKTPTTLHNHNHGFMSRIIIGGLHMTEYTTWRPPHSSQADEWYIPHQCVPRTGKDTLLEQSDHPVRLTGKREFWLEEGSEYTFPLNPDLFHEVEPGWGGSPAVITKVMGIPHIGNEKELPTVLVHERFEPDNDFDRYGHDEIARKIYESAVCFLLDGKL